MDELVPIVISAVLGLLTCLNTTGRARLVLGVLIVLIVGLTATIVSGEYLQSGGFLLLDLTECAIATLAGFLVGHLIIRKRGGHPGDTAKVPVTRSRTS